jgi:uracil-DNA glycosylase
MLRPLLIGQAPGPNTDPSEPLSGASGKRLAALCGLDLEEFLARFERANLLPEFPGKIGKGDRFPVALARPLARSLAGRCLDRRVVLLGNGVASAFGWRAPWLRWSLAAAAAAARPDHQNPVLVVATADRRRRHPAEGEVLAGAVNGDVSPPLFAISPHPSGISHFWNSPSNVARARRFWRRLAREAARGP